MGNKHLKKCSESLIIVEVQIRTTMRYHLPPVKMAIIKKSTNNKCWSGCGEKGNFLHYWLEIKMVQTLWRMVWRYLRKLFTSSHLGSVVNKSDWNHEVLGSIPALAHWVKDPALP